MKAIETRQFKSSRKLSCLIVIALLFTIWGSTPTASADSFGSPVVWHNDFCSRGFNPWCDVGDFNGDGKDDIVNFAYNSEGASDYGDVHVALSTGNSFGASSLWHGFFCIEGEVCGVGDFNGDGKDDIVTFINNKATDPGRGFVYVALSTGTGFGASSLWHNFFCPEGEVCGVGDFNGDDKDDIVTFLSNNPGDPGYGDVYVALSTGTGFGVSFLWHDFFCPHAEVCNVGDFNGDGKDDIITFINNTANDPGRGFVYVALSTGTGFGVSFLWHDFFCPSPEYCEVGDFNGDGKDDIVTFVDDEQDPNRDRVWVALSTGSKFGNSNIWATRSYCGHAIAADEFPHIAWCGVGDFNGSGTTDTITFIRDSTQGTQVGDVLVGLTITDYYLPHVRR
jgi:hypothetical protein